MTPEKPETKTVHLKGKALDDLLSSLGWSGARPRRLSGFFDGLLILGATMASLCAGAAMIAWLTLLPSIGFLWMIGWLK